MENLANMRGQKSLPIQVDGRLVKCFPLAPFSYYRDARKLIEQAGLRVPTGKEMALFLDLVYNSSKPEIRDASGSVDVRKAIGSGQIYDFKKNLYTRSGLNGQRGIFVVRDPNVVGFSKRLDKSVLLSKLSASGQTSEGVIHTPDWEVAFAPEGTYLGRSFDAGNGYLIARFEGEEGAEAVVRVSRNRAHFKFAGPTSLDLIESSDFETISEIGGDIGLGVYGCSWPDRDSQHWINYAFGVSD